MIIFYREDGTIEMVEHDVNAPTFPVGPTEDKLAYYASIGLTFINVPETPNIMEYKVGELVNGQLTLIPKNNTEVI